MGINTYTGTTSLGTYGVNGGTLAISQAQNLGAGALILSGGTLITNSNVILPQSIDLDQGIAIGEGPRNGGGLFYTVAGTLTLDGQLSGNGGLFKQGNGTLILNTASPYSPYTWVQGGTLQGNSLTLPGYIENDANVTFNQEVNGTYSGMIVGTGSLTKTGGATLTLFTNNAYSGGTIVLGGALAGDTTSLRGNILNNANVVFNEYSTGAYSGLMSGSGMLIKTGNGYLTLSAANTYSGGTNVAAGTLAIAAVNAAGSGLLNVSSDASFDLTTFNQTVSGLSGSGFVTSDGGVLTDTGTGIFTGKIISAAAFSKSTAGNQVLDGSSTFASTTVSDGGLEIGDAANSGAMLASPVTVTSGGTLLGHGTIIGSVTNSGGTVQPGGTIGTLSVQGNYTQASNSTLAIELNPTTSSKLAVSGTASLAGTLALMPDAGNYTAGTQYQILTAAGGVSGRFATVTNSMPSLTFSETYLPNAVDLTVGGNNVTFQMGPLTSNEASATRAIESILTPTATGAFAQGLVSLGTAPALAGQHTALAGVLGEARADLATVDLANLTSFQNFLVERMDRRQGLTSTMEVNNGLPGMLDISGNLNGVQLAQNGSTDMPLFGSGGMVDIDAPSVWVHGYGVLGSAGGETGFQDFQYQTGGIVAGVDSKVSDTTLLGLAVAYEHTDLKLTGDNGNSGDSNQIDTYRVSVYGSQKLDPVGVPLTLDAAFGYAFNDYHDNDFLPLPNAGGGFSQTSRHDGNELTAETGLSQDVHIGQTLLPGALTVVPRVGVEYDNIQQNPYATTGAPAAGLNFQTNGSTLNALRSTVGARADLKLTANDGTVITPEVRATYLHDFMDTNVPLTEAFTGAPGAGFNVSGVRPGREAALVGTGVTVGFSENVSATIGYDAAVRDHELDHTVQVGIKYTW